MLSLSSTNRRTSIMNTRRAERSPASMLEALEGRQLMVVPGQSQIFNYNGADWRLQLTGPGSFTVQSDAMFGITQIALSNTTLASSFSVTPVAPLNRQARITPTLNIEKITGGTLNSITLDAETVDLESQSFSSNLPLSARGGDPAETGILLTGYAKTITVGDIFGADIRMDSTSSANRSTITADLVIGHDIAFLNRGGNPDSSNITSGGVIDSFTATNYVFGTMQAARVGSITINNNFTANRGGFFILQPEFDLTTTSSTATFGVKTIDIKGPLFAGNWTIAAPVQRISLGTVNNDDFARGVFPGDITVDVNGRLGQLISGGDLYGSYTATSFGSIQVFDELGARIIADGPASDTTNSIDSIRAARIGGGANEIEVPNGIGLLNVGTIDDTVIDAGWIDTVNVTGAPSVNEVITSSTITFTNTNRQSVNKKINVQGAVGGSGFVGTGDLGDITVRSLINSRIVTGIGSVTNLPLVAGAVGTKTIKSFTMTGPLDTNPNFVNSIVVAGTISKLTVNAPRVTTANSGTPFGIVANTITSYSYIAGPGSSSSGSNLTSGNIVSVGDFRIAAL